jgi:hypothetical protein
MVVLNSVEIWMVIFLIFFLSIMFIWQWVQQKQSGAWILKLNSSLRTKLSKLGLGMIEAIIGSYWLMKYIKKSSIVDLSYMIVFFILSLMFVLQSFMKEGLKEKGVYSTNNGLYKWKHLKSYQWEDSKIIFETKGGIFRFSTITLSDIPLDKKDEIDDFLSGK